jgi:hypothetical protein
MATLSYDRPGGIVNGPARSAASIVAILSAITSFVLSANGREVLALVAAVIAIGAGMLGGMRALSPRVSGGILSILAVVLGVVAVLVAVIALFV